MDAAKRGWAAALSWTRGAAARRREWVWCGGELGFWSVGQGVGSGGYLPAGYLRTITDMWAWKTSSRSCPTTQLNDRKPPGVQK
jgi:hypothetical protein